MSAKWSISNLPALAAICLLLLWCSPLSAQERDTVIIVKHDTVYLQRKPDTVVTGRTRHSRYDRRVHRYRKRWEALIPTHTKIQFAGNMGLLSLGTGWDYGKRNQWGNGCFSGCPAQISVRLHQTDIYLEAELHPLEPANQGKPVLGRTPYLRYVLQHRVRR